MKLLHLKETKMKHIFLVLLTIFAIGCTEGDENSNTPDSVIGGADPVTETVQLPNCDGGERLEVYPSDVLTPTSEDARVKIMHDQNDKLICASAGTATLTTTR